MMILKILVEIPDPRQPGSFKSLYDHKVQLSDSLVVDYAALQRSFDFLYPYSNKVLTFKIFEL